MLAVQDDGATFFHRRLRHYRQAWKVLDVGPSLEYLEYIGVNSIFKEEQPGDVLPQRHSFIRVLSFGQDMWKYFAPEDFARRRATIIQKNPDGVAIFLGAELPEAYIVLP